VTHEEFDLQINRILDTFGNYPPERIALIFKAFERKDKHKFKLIVDYLIANHRVSPVLNDFHTADIKVDEEKSRAQRILCDYNQLRSIDDILNLPEGTATREVVRMCKQNLQRFLSWQIEMPEFLKECDRIDVLVGNKGRG
jgi:hypothetical protein